MKTTSCTERYYSEGIEYFRIGSRNEYKHRFAKTMKKPKMLFRLTLFNLLNAGEDNLPIKDDEHYGNHGPTPLLYIYMVSHCFGKIFGTKIINI